MANTAILLVLLAMTAVTDVRWRMIPNGICYSGMAVAFALSAAATWWGIDSSQGTIEQIACWGFVSVADALAGWLICGGLMLVCYLLFAQGVGGGDVKLMAMVGAFLGMHQGLEAILWTFVLAGCQSLIVLIWRYGVWRILEQAWRLVRLARRTGGQARLSEAERRPLQHPLFLSPSALLAVSIVRLAVLDRIAA